MQTRISKWGNSVGIRIPHKTLERLNFSIDDILDIDIKNKSIVLNKKTTIEVKIPMSKILKGFNNNKEKEFIKNKIGKEIW